MRQGMVHSAVELTNPLSQAWPPERPYAPSTSQTGHHNTTQHLTAQHIRPHYSSAPTQLNSTQRTTTRHHTWYLPGIKGVEQRPKNTESHWSIAPWRSRSAAAPDSRWPSCRRSSPLRWDWGVDRGGRAASRSGSECDCSIWARGGYKVVAEAAPTLAPPTTQALRTGSGPQAGRSIKALPSTTCQRFG